MRREDILIFLPDGIVQSVDRVPISTRADPQNWIIADAVLPPIEAFVCRIVVVTSPKLAHESDLYKSGFQYRYMPLWTQDEIEKVREKAYAHKGREDVEKDFEVWGGTQDCIAISRR